MNCYEALDRLNEIQRKSHTAPISRKERKEFADIQKYVLRPLGYRIVRERSHPVVWKLKSIVEEKAKRETRFLCAWICKDVSPEHRHLKGNCTTRSMTYALGGAMTYDEIEREQYGYAAKYGRLRNESGIWERVLTTRGWKEIRLSGKIRRDRFAVLTKDIDCPIVTVSSRHAAIVDRGSVVDSWDSRGGRVSKILVREEFADSVRHLSATK